MKQPIMDGQRLYGTLVALTLAALCAAPADGGPVATTPHFAFHSDFETNLNDALIAAGAARNRSWPQPFQGDSDEASCFAGLAPSARAGWNLAVDWYAEIVSPADWQDRQQYLLRMHLAGLAEEPDERTRRYLDVARGFRMAAAPAYEACRWPARDAENRRWIGHAVERVELHGPAIAPRLAESYGRPWPTLPIRIDVVPAALPVGANTISDPPHVQISSDVSDRDALEIVFHEASHTLAGRNDPLQRALARAAAEVDRDLPGDLWHVVLFYTTGRVVREALEAAGEPGYVPYVDHHDLWRGRWGRYRHAIETTWPAYLAGERGLEAAAAELLRALDVASHE